MVRPRLEGLEPRCLLSGPGSLSPDALFHETLDRALDLGPLALGGHVGAGGVIGTGPHGAADVNWYEFALSSTAEVRLSALPGSGGRPLAAALSLYNDAPFDKFSPIDPYTPAGHRLLARDDAGSHRGPAVLDRLLGPGNYWVAVSGSDNDDFYPFLADSGFDGATGAYRLAVTASDPGLAYDDPTIPVVLGSDPAPGAVLATSPFVLRFDLNAPIDPFGVTVGSDPSNTAQLWFNTANDFSHGGGATQVDLSWARVSLEQNADGNDNELQIAPANPLPAGYYRAVLAGYGPGGSDYVVPFRVAGPADSIFAARDIPHAADGRLHQVAGAVGVDPADPFWFNPGSVEFYRFSIDGPGLYAVGAEIFAGRIGSPLDPALTLYRLGPLGDLEFVASNGDTGDRALAGDGHEPLYTDSALLLSLPRGEYYLAVSSGLDFPDPNDPTRSDIFNPFVPQPAAAGNSTGPYVLNLLVQPAETAPHVVAVQPDRGPAGDGPLTAVRVRFSEPVNLLPLAFQPSRPSPGPVSARLTDAAGRSYDLSLDSYDIGTNTATFALLSGVPAGTYTLHLPGAGPQAITGEGGTPLAGNAPGGTEFTATFAVSGSAAVGTSFASLPGFDSPNSPQPVGVLFPDQLSDGVTITRDASAGAGATEQDYSFRLLQQRSYTLTVNGDSLPPGLTLTILDAAGAAVVSYAYDPANPSAPLLLAPGTYTLQVTWSGGVGTYALQLSLAGTPENPVPLVVGSGPALRTRLLTAAPDTTAPLIATASTPAPAPATPASAGGSLAAGLLALPSSPLIAQAFSPLNGVSAPSGVALDGGGRLLVRAPAAAPIETVLLGILIGTQPPLPDGADGPPAPGDATPTPGPTGGQSVAQPGVVLRVLDDFFEAWGWFGIPMPVPAPAPSPTPPAATGGEVGNDDVGATLPGADGRAPDDNGPLPWLALAAGAVLLPEYRRRSRGARIGIADAVLPKGR